MLKVPVKIISLNFLQLVVAEEARKEEPLIALEALEVVPAELGKQKKKKKRFAIENCIENNNDLYHLAQSILHRR